MLNRILTRIATRLHLASIDSVWVPKDYQNILSRYDIPLNLQLPSADVKANQITKDVAAALEQLNTLYKKFVRNLKSEIGANKRTQFINAWNKIKSQYKKTFTADATTLEKELDPSFKKLIPYIGLFGEFFSDLSSGEGILDVVPVSKRNFYKFYQLHGGANLTTELEQARNNYLKQMDSLRNKGIQNFDDYIEYLTTDKQQNSFSDQDLKQNKSSIK